MSKRLFVASVLISSLLIGVTVSAQERSPRYGPGEEKRGSSILEPYPPFRDFGPDNELREAERFLRGHGKRSPATLLEAPDAASPAATETYVFVRKWGISHHSADGIVYNPAGIAINSAGDVTLLIMTNIASRSKEDTDGIEPFDGRLPQNISRQAFCLR